MGGDTMLCGPALPDIPYMWKRDGSRQSDLQDAVNRTRDELRRFAPEGSEPLPRTELPAPDADDAASPADVADVTMKKPHISPTPNAARLGLPPFVQGLLEILPEPGADWPPVKREQWLEAARNIFALMYGDSSEQRPAIHLIDTPPTDATTRANPDSAVGRYSA